MDWINPLLPATILTAVTLFILKELLEFSRRWRGDNRRRRAFRSLLTREIELNNYANRILRHTLQAIAEDFDEKLGTEYRIVRHPSGQWMFEHRYRGKKFLGWRAPAARLH
jgi:hypothetical protein